MQDDSTQAREKVMTPKVWGSIAATLGGAAIIWLVSSVAGHDRKLAEIEVRIAQVSSDQQEFKRLTEQLPSRLTRIEVLLEELLGRQKPHPR